MNDTIIGITDCSKFANYERWLTNEPGIKIIKLGYKENNLGQIKNCHGILLTGGQDVHPRFYNKPEYIKFCGPIDEQRDEFEWKVLEYSQEQKLPVLGICRGLQLSNIFFGGDLIPDLIAFGKSDHRKNQDNDRYHNVEVQMNSQLQEIANVEDGEINSAHHQSVDTTGKGLVINALSKDGIIEGLERKEKTLPFLLLVQWHPERMMDKEKNPLSERIKTRFIEEAKSKQITK